MTAALTYKELRECAGIAALGLAALLLVALVGMRWSPLPDVIAPAGQGGIPFVSDTFTTYLAFGAFALALALGLRQSIGDLVGDAQLFLLHRPVDRRRIYATKLAVGLGLYLLCAIAPIAVYAWWAATPGTHASPFHWSMTAPAWTTWLAMTAVYLGAFLAGIRPGNWFGTRLAPLAASLSVLLLVSLTPTSIGLPAIAVADFALIVAILLVVETRDFA
jgi:hypothetical protein